MSKPAANQTLYCIVDRKPIPPERAVRKSNTCSKDCNKVLKGIRRAQVDSRKCRVCFKPSSPDERKSYRAFTRSNPEFKPAKRGRKPKAEAAHASV